MSPIRVANAPCSYGAFEVTVGKLPNVPDAVEVLSSMADAGYEGTELGPPGYLGEGDLLRSRLHESGLELVGGYVPVRFSEPERLEEDLAGLEATLDAFEAVGAADAKPVFADGGSPARAARPGAAARDRTVGLDEDGWRRLADGIVGDGSRRPVLRVHGRPHRLQHAPRRSAPPVEPVGNGYPASPNGLPSESRQTAKRSPG